MSNISIKIIQNQEEILSNNLNISENDINKLLMKYNYTNNTNNIDTNLSFEDMCKIEDKKRKEELENEYLRKLEYDNRPKAITFSDKDVRYYDTKTLDSDGISFEVKVCTNIPTNK